MSEITQAKRVVVKVGTSTLTYENGKLNLRRVESLCKVLTDLQNAGREIVLVKAGPAGKTQRNGKKAGSGCCGSVRADVYL